MSVSLHNYNFERNLFSGDPRQAHQFIPFLQSKLGEAKLSYILKTDAIPHLDEFLVILERQHKDALQEAARVFTNKHMVWETRLLPVYQHRIVTIQNDMTKTPATKKAEIDALPMSLEPTLELPQTQFTSAMETQLSKLRGRIRHTESDADAAIQLVKKYLSVCILNSCVAALNDAKQSIANSS